MSDDFIFSQDTFILIGKVANVHGLKGQVKIFPYSRQPENIRSYKKLVLVTQKGKLSDTLKVTQCRVQKNMAIVSLDTIKTREQSEELVGMGVLLNKVDLPVIKNGEFYWRDFIGQQVFIQSGEPIGQVKQLFFNGAQDVLVVVDKNQEHLIPVTNDVLVSHNKEGLVINPPPGLLSLNSGVDE